MSRCEKANLLAMRDSGAATVVTYLLVRVHRGEAAVVAGLASLACDLFDLFLGAVGEVSWVGVGRHGWSWKFASCVWGVWGFVVFGGLWCFCRYGQYRIEEESASDFDEGFFALQRWKVWSGRG